MAWSKTSRQARGYGRAWELIREQVLRRDNGLCQCPQCKGKLPPKIATEVDHITPKAMGGTDAMDNLRAVSSDCHKRITAEYQGANFMPEWLPRPRIPTTVVYGPPGSGKSTYVRERAAASDLVLDLDEIAAMLSGKPIYHASVDDWRAAVRWRNTTLASLAKPSAYRRCWLILTAPKGEHRRWWQRKLGAEMVEMSTPILECMRRIAADPRRPKALKAAHTEALRTYENEATAKLAAHTRRRAIGVDGYPCA